MSAILIGGMRGLSLMVIALAWCGFGCELQRPSTPSASRPFTGKGDDIVSCDPDCADHEVCAPGLCPDDCDEDDEGCCEPNACLPSCDSEDDCALGLECTADGYCDFLPRE